MVEQAGYIPYKRQLPPPQEPLNVTSEFGALKPLGELGESFFRGGIWLARQKDPLAQFQKLIESASRVNAGKIAEAQMQFASLMGINPVDAANLFDTIIGASILQINPKQFLDAIKTYFDSQDQRQFRQISDALFGNEKNNNILPKEPLLIKNNKVQFQGYLKELNNNIKKQFP